MKPDLLDNGMDSVLALQNFGLSQQTNKRPYEVIERVMRVVERAEQLMPGMGFGECARAIHQIGFAELVLQLEDTVAQLKSERDDARANYETCVDSHAHD